MELRRSARIKQKTRPASPRLLTKSRSRNYKIESSAEKEERELEEIRKYKFHAKAPPNCIFEDKPSGLPKKKTRKVTRAKTPMALKRKVSKTAVTKAKNKTSNNAIKKLKALPMPDLKKIFEVTKAENKRTIPEPFSFENKYEHPNAVKERLLKETKEKESAQREFKATQLYESEGFALNKNLSRTTTKISAFNLTNPEFHSQKLRNLEERVEKENIEMQKKRDFKATYPHVIFEEPFEPVKDSRYCKIEEFNLHSERRGEDRRKFDEEVALQKEQLAREMEHEKITREKQEAEEVAELRRKQVHRANKIGEFKKQPYEELSLK